MSFDSMWWTPTSFHRKAGARQGEMYLEMHDAERAKIMKRARDGGFAIVDCHSHLGSAGDVWFSPSDCRGITEFAPYARWKLGGNPYAAMVWGESSIDAVGWEGDFTRPIPISEVRIAGDGVQVLIPTGSWFRKPDAIRCRSDHER